MATSSALSSWEGEGSSWFTGFEEYAEIMDVEKGCKKRPELGMLVREFNKRLRWGAENKNEGRENKRSRKEDCENEDCKSFVEHPISIINTTQHPTPSTPSRQQQGQQQRKPPPNPEHHRSHPNINDFPPVSTDISSITSKPEACAHVSKYTDRLRLLLLRRGDPQ